MLVLSLLAFTAVLATPVPNPVPDPVPELDKAPVRPDLQLAQGFIDHTSVPKITYLAFPQHKLPADCKRVADDNKIAVSDIGAFKFRYADCPEPWVFCRHKDAQVSRAELLDAFGRLPVGIRNYVRTITALPSDSANAANGGDSITLFGDLKNLPMVLAHEIAHTIDTHLEGYKKFSDSKPWLDAYNRDPDVPDNYARTSQAENFAQAVTVALYDSTVPNGIKTAITDADKIQNQYRTVQEYLPEGTFSRGRTCRRVFRNSPLVDV